MKPLVAVVAFAAVALLLASACTSPVTEEHNRGVELADQGRWEEAIVELDMAIELEPDPLTYLARGTAHGQIAFNFLLQQRDATGAAKEFEMALADLDRAIELEPTLPEAWSERAAVYAQQLEFDRAVEDLQVALALVEDGPLRIGLAELIFQGDGELPEGELTPSLCDELSTIEERTVSMDGELEQVEMVIFSGDLTAEEKMERGVLLVSGYTVTPLWERIQSQ